MNSWTLASWNVNSLRVRAPQVSQWLLDEHIDVACLQETKCVDSEFPHQPFTDLGFHSVYIGQKTYNGVALLSRFPIEDVLKCPDHWDPEGEKRFLAATIQGVRIINVYVPNGMVLGSPKFEYKLQWLLDLKEVIRAELKQHKHLVVLGDFNIAPSISDVHDPEYWSQNILFTPPERDALQELLDLGLEDSFRWWEQPVQSYSWWDYRNRSFVRKIGLRIDLILATPSMRASALSSGIHTELRKHERPSDHAPVYLTLKNHLD